MTHNMVWTAEHCRWLCYECGRVDEATPDGDFVRNEVLGDARVPHIRNRMGIMRPEKPLPRREPQIGGIIGWLDTGNLGHLLPHPPPPPVASPDADYRIDVDGIRQQFEKMFGFPPGTFTPQNLVAPAIEQAIVEKNFMTPSDEKWLLERGIGHDDRH